MPFIVNNTNEAAFAILFKINNEENEILALDNNEQIIANATAKIAPIDKKNRKRNIENIKQYIRSVYITSFINIIMATKANDMVIFEKYFQKFEVAYQNKLYYVKFYFGKNEYFSNKCLWISYSLQEDGTIIREKNKIDWKSPIIKYEVIYNSFFDLFIDEQLTHKKIRGIHEKIKNIIIKTEVLALLLR